MKTRTVGKNGIRQLYIGFAKSYLKPYYKEGKEGEVEKISRQKIELQLLEEIEKWEFPIEYKLSWYHEVLVSSNFDGFWEAVSERFTLPVSCTTRYVTDRSLLEYDVPTDDEADESVEDEIHNDTVATEKSSPTSVPQTPGLVTDHESRSSTPDSSDESSRESTPDEWPQLSVAALTRVVRVIKRCAKCGQGGVETWCCPCKTYNDDNNDDSNIAGPSNHSSEVEGGQEAKTLDKQLGALDGDQPAASGLDKHLGALDEDQPAASGLDKHLGALDEDQPAASGGPKRLAREYGDDSEYENAPSKTNGEGKAPGPVKAASKPRGVTKNRAAPKKKEQTPAQLKTAAAKTREPAKREATKTKSTKPKATKKAVTPPDQNLDTPSHTASNGNNEQSQVLTVGDKVHHSEAQLRASMVAPPSTGIKRTMEQFRDDDEDDSPATKKAKIGGAASANGGRKKAIPKMSNKKKDDFEEWDGIPRGFGEY